jgi:hypothetical protein
MRPFYQLKGKIHRSPRTLFFGEFPTKSRKSQLWRKKVLITAYANYPKKSGHKAAIM